MPDLKMLLNYTKEKNGVIPVPLKESNVILKTIFFSMYIAQGPNYGKEIRIQVTDVCAKEQILLYPFLINKTDFTHHFLHCI